MDALDAITDSVRLGRAVYVAEDIHDEIRDLADHIERDDSDSEYPQVRYHGTLPEYDGDWCVSVLASK